MKTAYVFGPIHLFGQDYLPVYKHLMSLCKKYFDKVLLQNKLSDLGMKPI